MYSIHRSKFTFLHTTPRHHSLSASFTIDNFVFIAHRSGVSFYFSFPLSSNWIHLEIHLEKRGLLTMHLRIFMSRKQIKTKRTKIKTTKIFSIWYEIFIHFFALCARQCWHLYFYWSCLQSDLIWFKQFKKIGNLIRCLWLFFVLLI